jgi:hypothetical protein
MSDDQDQQIRALRERVAELERQIAAREREIAIEEAKATPRQRAIVDGRLAERDERPLN